MPVSPTPPLHTFIPWRERFLPALADHLLAHRTATAPWDLRDLLVVVPTRQAGRRLREALATLAAAHSTGVLGPLTLTPDALVSSSPSANSSARPATTPDALAAWLHSLLHAPLDDFREVFPLDPPERDAPWALGVARELHRVQSTLADHDLSFADVARRVADTALEPDRWAQLAALETHWLQHLATLDLVSPLAATRLALAQLAPPENIRRIVVAGVLDLLAPARSLLARWTTHPDLAVELITHGDPAENLHDTWGRPAAEQILPRHLSLDPAHVGLHPLRDLPSLSAHLGAVAHAYADAPATLAIGLTDPADAPALRLGLERENIPAFDPAGRPLSATPAGKVATLLADLARDDTLDAALALLRSPLFAAHCIASINHATDHASLLRAYDELHAAHLPADIDDLAAFARADIAAGTLSPVSARACSALADALDHLAATRDRLRAGPFASALLSILATWTAHRDLHLADPADAAFAESAQKLRDVLLAHTEVESRHPDAPPALWPLLLRASLATEQIFPEREPGALELSGWLELAYQAAPHLVLAGANEGRLPETIRPDAFLPEPLRRHLGLPTHDDRYARDFLLLEGLLRSRAADGRVDLLIPRLGPDGDPLQPSRLLFACDDATLVPRALRLFADLPPPPPAPPRRRAWRLGALPPESIPEKFSPSRLRAYLDCPYHYYLEYGLRMASVDAAKSDLDALDFGLLCHAALEALGREPALRNTTDAELITRFLHEKIDAAALRQWGRNPPLPVAVQIAAARSRLAAFALQEVAQRAAGWTTLHVEHAWEYARHGRVFHGRIDRVDTHPELGVRVLDYKTSETATAPDRAHLARHTRPLPHVLDAALLDIEGKAMRWTDLQLPLYVLALRNDFPDTAVTAGYVCLPKTQADVDFALWPALAAPALLESAEACALAAADAILARRFWPPNPTLKPRRLGDFAPLFPDARELDADGDAISALALPALP
jgi:ATP-dependent helicase/nuclease subunit B